ncbi:MAG: hypothetical protein COV67_10695 [Nitrospinae bacterium CG11_big_fil_rev_8_21_14_0_20_56_8]|nr:MAG: hypothetical protein COV67_10695 [Nitrospinae bacterium CG11_big_fil_rev_8_21_14_0_20_56_8]
MNLSLEQRLSWLVFLFFLSVYLLTSQGSIQSSDGKIMYFLTQAVIEHHQFNLSDYFDGSTVERFSKYGLGMSVLAIPFYVAGLGLSKVLGIDPVFTTTFCVSLINAWVTALSCLMVFRFGRDRFNFRYRTAWVLSLAFGLSTPAWVYSEDFMSEPATTLVLLCAAYLITDPRPALKNQNLLWAGIFLGLGLLFRASTAIALPGFLLYLALTGGHRGGEKYCDLLADLARFTLPLLLFLCVIFFYNFVRYQNIFVSGYEKGFGPWLFKGLYGILFSPGKSMFLYAPVLMLGCAGIPGFFRSRPGSALLFVWIILAHLMLFSCWHSWFGGLSWGPRLMLVTFPFLVLPAGFLLESNPRVFNTPVAYLIALGILIQIPGVTVNMARYYYFMKAEYGEKAHDLILYSAPHTPLLGQFGMMGQVIRNLGDRKGMEERVAIAKQQGRFTGMDPATVLKKGLAVNAPNFWWLYLYLFGYPFIMAGLPPLVLLSTVWICGYKINILTGEPHRPSPDS